MGGRRRTETVPRGRRRGSARRMHQAAVGKTAGAVKDGRKAWDANLAWARRPDSSTLAELPGRHLRLKANARTFAHQANDWKFRPGYRRGRRRRNIVTVYTGYARAWLRGA